MYHYIFPGDSDSIVYHVQSDEIIELTVEQFSNVYLKTVIPINMSSLYKVAVSVGDKIVPQALVPLWQHPAGNKTLEQ